jgi:hypothetical protein
MKPSNSQPNLKQKNKAGAEITENYLSSLKSEDYTGSFNRVETWLKNKTEEKQTRIKERNLVKMKNYFFSHKIRIAYAVILLAVIAAACNMPVTQHETVGYVLAWTVPADNTTAFSQIEGLSWIDKSKMTVNENNDDGKSETLYTLTLPGSTGEQVSAYAKDLEKISGIISIKILPLNEDIKRPLYSAALHKFFKIDIDAANMSDLELKQEVTGKLKEAGIENPDVDIKTDENGNRTFKMKISQEQMENSPNNLEVRIDDGNNHEVMKLVHNNLDADKLKGKTDREIRDYVKQMNPELNLQDNEIKIIREGENAKVEISREKIEKR